MIVIVGGHTRNIGKTTVAAQIIEQIPEARWTAVKITQYGHGVCSNSGEPCGCQTAPECPFEIDEEQAPSSTDSGRFLAAGAAHAYWLRTAQGQLALAMPRIHELIRESENIVFESNSLLQFIKPDLFVAVVDFRIADRKLSFQRYADRADAFVITGGEGKEQQAWMRGKAILDGTPPALAEFVRQKLGILR